MNNKYLLFLAVLMLFTKVSFSQEFVEDISAYESITLEDFVKNHSFPTISVKESYPKEDFVRVSRKLERLYFSIVGAELRKSDSLSISKNFKKLPRLLSRDYRKATKRLINKLKHFKASVNNNSKYVIKPRYQLEVEPNPIAYNISLEYVLINKINNKTYKIK